MLLTAPIPRFEIGESSTVAAARQPRSTMARRVDYGFVDTLDANTLRRYLSFLYTTHDQERVETRQDLDRSKAHIKALEAWIAVLETQAYRHEW
ncbi:hypothetical protein Tco_0787776 [Tanacetum coccineum]